MWKRARAFLLLVALATVATAACAIAGSVLCDPPSTVSKAWINASGRTPLVLHGSTMLRQRHCIRFGVSSQRHELLRSWRDPMLGGLIHAQDPRRTQYHRRQNLLEGAIAARADETTPRELPLSRSMRAGLERVSVENPPDLLIIDTAGWPFATVECDSVIDALSTNPPHFDERLSGGVIVGSPGLGGWATLGAHLPLASYRTAPYRIQWLGALGSVGAWTLLLASGWAAIVSLGVRFPGSLWQLWAFRPHASR